MSKKKVLAAIANYRSDEHVFNEAVKLAKNKGSAAELLLLHVSPNKGMHDTKALEMLRLRAEEAEIVGIPTRIHIDYGKPGESICNHAEEWDTDYVVVGYRDRSNWGEPGPGSVSAYVAQHISKGHSVMVVHPSIKILVAMESVEKDKHVFTHAKSLAQHLHASLILLHILSAQDEKNLEQGANPIFTEELEIMANDMAKKGISTDLDYIPGDQSHPVIAEELALLAHQTTEAGIPTEFGCRPGATGEGICEYARDWDAGVIVIGSRQSPSLSERLLGRVSEYVVNHASCSVMIIHPPGVETTG